ncbi:SRPBCC family protein [Nocardia cyriacigeorgica]|uniref:SRPBCC family protein n=1 Tax=Nocardia cyriacigeorgica TaxID=135487 RepID=UPI001893838F|nr:SRPBCC family protein [Nocardia cyriacigeorgica]MBF6435874.1 SRPBCC family protein [Nocardia cyriacigeorgica]MBF6454047.1 SRPBCC family protein [Nocardia cyriacigeorgica]MBF6477755.1 SRPBCC family protein [Nocardia cyriacigeorgica]MBF6551941.1 SRPBCC family protein [Nocardia cyriacigeorgica]
MTPSPTGRLFPAQTGRDLVLTRTYRAPIEDVWASITESDRTARWFGPWEGEAGTGKTIKVQMAFEDDQPWMDMRIDTCEPPRHLGVSAEDEAGSWFLDIELTESGGTTELRFTHHLRSDDEVAQAPQVGPGWEFYLDMLGAARANTDRPDFDDYYPAMKPYYEQQIG